jgi:predicted CXXCH cytochrome family protein
MRALAVLLFATVSVARAAAAADSCVACHTALGDPFNIPVEGMKVDVHGKAGLSCADCHGGDPADPDTTAMDEAKGFVRPLPPKAIPALCGRCHADESFMRRYDPQMPTDQLSDFRTSVHGQRLGAGDTQVATCVSCHGVHGILPASDARSPVHPTNVPTTCARCHNDPAHMAAYGIATDQFLKYQRSVHGHLLLVQRDVSAPACNDCHGNHGAFPPGADSVAMVCGQCHPINKELFLASPHAVAFKRLELPECVTCHGNHEVVRPTDDLLGTGPTAVCIGCHAPESKGYAAAGQMRASVGELTQAIAAAEEALGRATTAGMEVGEEDVALQTAREALIQTRNQVHSFDLAGLQKVAGPATTTARGVERNARAALVEFTNRRWLAAIPLGMIALVGVLLYARIRSLDRELPPPGA